jgi:hypothetical protein
MMAPQFDTELIIEVPYKQVEIPSAQEALPKFEDSSTVTGTYLGQKATGFGAGVHGGTSFTILRDQRGWWEPVIRAARSSGWMKDGGIGGPQL